MDGYIVHGDSGMPLSGMGMSRGSIARIEDGKGILLYVWDGELWITQEGDRRDYLVRRGQWFQLERDGTVVAHAIRRSSIAMTAPVPAYYARRISVVLPGTGLPRVIYDRAHERGGWLAAARHRASRLWASSYVRFSNPTTASL